MDKEKRNIKVIVEGNKTEEGRLKVEKIHNYRRDANDDKINAIFMAIMAACDAILVIISSSLIKKAIIKTPINSFLTILGMINAARSVGFMLEKRKNDKYAYELEEEILNAK